MTALRKLLACAALLGALSAPAAAQPSTSPTDQAWPFVEVSRSNTKTDTNPKAFGPLTLGMDESSVKTRLGPPQLTTRRSMMGMSDEFTYTWDYTSLGVTLYFSAYDEVSPGTIMAIRAKPPCDWTAYGGLKVGMPIEDASKILGRGGGGSSPIGSVGTEMAGLFFGRIDTAVVAALQMGMISVLYVGPNMP